MNRIIRYKVKPDRAAENKQLCAVVFEEIARVKPPGVHYAAFHLDDGVSFVHLVSYDSEASNQGLTSLPTFKAFVANIRDRCEEPPVNLELKETGSYGFFSH